MNASQSSSSVVSSGAVCAGAANSLSSMSQTSEYSADRQIIISGGSMLSGLRFDRNVVCIAASLGESPSSYSSGAKTGNAEAL